MESVFMIGCCLNVAYCYQRYSQQGLKCQSLECWISHHFLHLKSLSFSFSFFLFLTTSSLSGTTVGHTASWEAECSLSASQTDHIWHLLPGNAMFLFVCVRMCECAKLSKPKSFKAGRFLTWDSLADYRIDWHYSNKNH